jgi:FKBP-type peptidyl-prolyl cis-trans isomerase SlyD
MKEEDFVEIEYVGRIKESGEIFDLTDEKLAKEKKIFNPKTKYGPITIILGAGHVLKGLDKEIQKLRVGEKKKIALEAKDAFGERDAKLFRVFPVSFFKKQKVNPMPGQIVDMGRAKGRVLSVAGGRVRVDFNHPLAGKSLEYEVKINKINKETKERILSILKFYTAKDDYQIDVKKNKVRIVISEMINIPLEIKKKMSDEVRKYISGIKEVEFSEVFK